MGVARHGEGASADCQERMPWWWLAVTVVRERAADESLIQIV